jgi:methionyl-tRNA formyltransferase
LLRLVFLGSSDFAVPVLTSLIADSGIEVGAVLTQPDRRAGRGRKITETPVSRRAAELGVPVKKPEKLREIRDWIQGMQPDVMVSAAYGMWLPLWLLETAPLGVVNVHPSLLPDYRGAAPVPRVILDGRHETGVSFMLTDSGWDTGPLIHAVKTTVKPDETAGKLSHRLSLMAAEILPAVLREYSGGGMRPSPQVGQGSYAGKLTRKESMLDWTKPADELERAVRAFNPSPGAWFHFDGRILKVFNARVCRGSGIPGTFSVLEHRRLMIAAGEGMLELLEVQPEAGKRMDSVSFIRGLRLPREQA